MIVIMGSTLVSATASADATPPVPTMTNCGSTLNMSASDAQFDVWTCGATATALADAKEALRVAELYDAAEATFMGGAPIPDTGSPAEGGDINIDLYLVTPDQEISRYDPATLQTDTVGLSQTDSDGNPVTAEAVTVPTDESGTTASGWMLLNDKHLGTEAFDSDFVHEYFHLLQYRTNTGNCGGKEWWFTEASATWAQSYFDNATALDEVYQRYVDGFETNPGMSLTSMAKDASGVPHGYASFIWPYFMAQEIGASSIANVWLQLNGVTSCPEMNADLSLVLPFNAHFQDFAVRNLDAPLPGLDGASPAWPQNFGATYQDIDPLFPQDLPTLAPPNVGISPIILPTSSTDPYPYTDPVPVSLPPLSAQYNEVNVYVNDIQFDFSGLTNTSSLDVTLVAADNGAQQNFIRVPVTGTHAHVCMTVDLNAPWASFPSTSGDYYIIVDNHSTKDTISGNYIVTGHNDCAASVAGTLTDTGSSKNGNMSAKWADTFNIDLADSVYGWNDSQTTEDASATQVITGKCEETEVLSGSGYVPVQVLDAFGGPASGAGPYLNVLEGPPATQTDTDCHGNTVTIQTEGGGGTFCSSAGQSSYGNARLSTLVFNCSYKAVGYSDKGTGKLTATGLDSCGLWTTGCSISVSSAVRAKTSLSKRS
jgi:hypothetical protein